jgi:OmpA-OmpF porin, OOP family
MKKKLICSALFGALAFAQVAAAQDFDDRWYISATGGVNLADDARDVGTGFIGGLGIGKFFSDNLSLDLEIDHTSPQNSGLNWQLETIGLTGRYHFIKEGRNWAPYLALGLGSARHEEEISGFPTQIDRKGNNLFTKLGFGAGADLGRFGVRAEAGARIDFDDNSVADPSADRFIDPYVALTGLVALGAEPGEAPTPAPAAPDCSAGDDDNDGVNNCNDRCPGSAAGQAVGADGCPVQLAIDLKGVNFDFDKDNLRPDAVAILNEAVDILKRYPQLRVEVAGHTDLCGDDGYNQSLSQRRASIVYKYLTDNGVDAGRLAGPNGFGESRPLAQTAQTVPACRSETNRRTELNVQN